ncbi:hypothetical protein Peur_060449 [Populus x canadensis]|jgi:hypothetical protein
MAKLGKNMMGKKLDENSKMLQCRPCNIAPSQDSGIEDSPNGGVTINQQTIFNHSYQSVKQRKRVCINIMTFIFMACHCLFGLKS